MEQDLMEAVAEDDLEMEEPEYDLGGGGED